MRDLLTTVIVLLLAGAACTAQAAQTTTLPSGDYVVVDTGYDLPGPVSNVGSVSLYSSAGVLLGRMTGSTANDQIGNGGVTVIGNSAFVVCSPLWDNGAAADAGAVTFGSTSVIPSGTVSASNSLVGSASNDYVGLIGNGTDSPITVIGTSTYLVRCPGWDHGPATNAGAIVQGSLSAPAVGTISTANALVGSSSNDLLGSLGGAFTDNPITAIGTSAYLIRCPGWDNGAAKNAGAIIPGFVSAPAKGVITAANALIGSSTNDLVGLLSGALSDNPITVIGTSGYLIRCPGWDNGPAVNAGAIVPGLVSAPAAGVISAANALVGSSSNDLLGLLSASSAASPITTIGSNTYLVRCPLWNNGAVTDAGAIVQGTVSAPVVGVISAANALVGSSANELLGLLTPASTASPITTIGTTAYLIRCPLWDNGTATDAGAIVQGSVSAPLAGVISAGNALVGSSSNDLVGLLTPSSTTSPITTIGSNAYLIRCPLWDNGTATDAGAIVQGAVSAPLVGVISAANALVGSTAYDYLGLLDGTTTTTPITTIGATAYLIRCPLWDNGAATDAGAIVQGFVSAPLVGVISATNALVGSTDRDYVGLLSANDTSSPITLIGTAAYLIRCPLWDNGAAVDAGAIVQGSISASLTGVISAGNALVGSTTYDYLGLLDGTTTTSPITLVGASGFVIRCLSWDHGPAANAGAVVYGVATARSVGTISAATALVGTHPNDWVGSGGITINGSIITVSSPAWCYNAGATTLGSTASGLFGVVSAANSTVGAKSAVPEIALQQPAPADLPINSTRDFGSVPTGGNTSLTFVIRNTGNDDLLLGGPPQVVISGTDAAQFSVVMQPRPLIVTGDSASFTVNFMPSSTGAKAALLSIASNDSNENPFQVYLTGTALGPQVATWRQTHFGSSANSGAGADDADFDHDGIPNLVEYALGLHPAQNTAGQLPLPAANGGSFGFSFTEPAGISGITYGAEWSTSLAAGSWLPVSDTGTPPQHVFSVPIGGNTKVFMRLKVSTVP